MRWVSEVGRLLIEATPLLLSANSRRVKELGNLPRSKSGVRGKLHTLITSDFKLSGRRSTGSWSESNWRKEIDELLMISMASFVHVFEQCSDVTELGMLEITWLLQRRWVREENMLIGRWKITGSVKLTMLEERWSKDWSNTSEEMLRWARWGSEGMHSLKLLFPIYNFVSVWGSASARHSEGFQVRKVINWTVKPITKTEVFEGWREAVHGLIETAPECEVCKGRWTGDLLIQVMPKWKMGESYRKKIDCLVEFVPKREVLECIRQMIYLQEWKGKERKDSSNQMKGVKYNR